MRSRLRNFFSRLIGKNDKRADDSRSKLKVAAWYDHAFESTEEYHKHYTKSVYYPLWTVILYQISEVSPKQILDIGCGPGQLAEAIFDHFPSISYFGFDFSASAIAMARRNVPSYHFEVADALHTDLYTTAGADMMICTEVLEHIDEDMAIIERLPCGVSFVASVPNFDSDSHIRFFRDQDEVEDRYGTYFDPFRVITLRYNDTSGRFFLFSGIKK